MGDIRTPFLDIDEPVAVEDAWAVVVPVPLDRGAAEAPGARLAPAEIVAAAWSQVETYDLEIGRDPTDRGLATAEPLALSYENDAAVLGPVARTVEEHLRAGRFPLLLGGEATILAGSARALAAVGDVGVVRLEGTLGADDDCFGLRAAPRTAVRRAAELVPVRSSGWRLASPAAQVFAAEHDLAGPPARRLVRRPGVAPVATDDLLRGLPERVWLAVDLSVLDPAALPMPGNLEPGGLAYADLTALLADVFERRRVVGAELTGLAPRPGDVYPTFLAARLGLRLLALAHRQRFPNVACA